MVNKEPVVYQKRPLENQLQCLLFQGGVTNHIYDLINNYTNDGWAIG